MLKELKWLLVLAAEMLPCNFQTSTFVYVPVTSFTALGPSLMPANTRRAASLGPETLSAQLSEAASASAPKRARKSEGSALLQQMPEMQEVRADDTAVPVLVTSEKEFVPGVSEVKFEKVSATLLARLDD